MGFLRRKSKSNGGVAVDESSKRPFPLFGKKKKSVTAVVETNLPENVGGVPSSRQMIFQHKFVTVHGDDIVDANNVTVDSMESIVIMTPEEAEKEQQQQQQDFPIDAGVDVVPPEEVMAKYYGKIDYPEDEQPSAATITVDEGHQEQQPYLPTDEEKKETTEMEQTNVNNDPQATQQQCMDDDDTDDITEKQVTDPASGVKSSSQNESDMSSDDARTRVEKAAGAFVQALTCTAQDVRNCATLPESLSGIAMPATASKPIVNEEAAAVGNAKVEHNEKDYFSEQVTQEFLNSLLNVGFTLVFHTSLDEDDDWFGRTVNFSFRPGICSARKISAPTIEWSTMGGGKMTGVETESIGLFQIDAVVVSNIRNELDPGSSQQYDDELDCFFSITSQNGEVFLFEALSAEESQRIVTGIKSVIFWLSSHIIEGDSKAVADYFDNSREPPESQLRRNAAMMRISHAYLDDAL